MHQRLKRAANGELEQHVVVQVQRVARSEVAPFPQGESCSVDVRTPILGPDSRADSRRR